MEDYSIVSLQSLPHFESTLDESDSYYFLAQYFQEKVLHFIYRYPAYSYDDIANLVNNFTFFCSKVKDTQTGKSYSSNIPVGFFRYILLEDMTWAPYYAVRRKPGYVVEGAYWSNGMFYQVREDKDKDFEVYEVTLMIDPLTQKMYSFPLLESRT